MAAPRILTTRQLNRALLARQLLLERDRSLSPAQAIEHLVGLQAQDPSTPYPALWSRLADFDPQALSRLIERRRAVRITLMRVTLHLVTARDALALRPVLQEMIARRFHGIPYGREARKADLGAVVAGAVELLEAEPRTHAEMREWLAARWPKVDAKSLDFAVSYLVPLVQVPPRGLFGRGGQVRLTTLASWLGQPVDPGPAEADDLVLRHLRAAGPASPRDVASWSGLTGLGSVFERLRPKLCVFRDGNGVELFDVPRAPLPDPDTPAPPRFLPVYDNALQSHADRSRVISPEHPSTLYVRGTLLVDGFSAAYWVIRRERRAARLEIEPFRRIARRDRDEVTEEGARMLEALTPEAESHGVEFVARR